MKLINIGAQFHNYECKFSVTKFPNKERNQNIILKQSQQFYNMFSNIIIMHSIMNEFGNGYEN